MPAGRPTKYNEDMQAKAEAYLEDYPTAIPSKQGLALYLKVSDVTIDNWSAKFPEFLGTLETIKNIQFVKALDGGLTGDYNSTIAKLVLHNHGLSDKTEVDNKSSDGTMTPIAPTKIELVAYEGDSVVSSD